MKHEAETLHTTPAKLAAELRVELDMLLPEGKSCADCASFSYCAKLFGCAPANVHCDFSPSRFRVAK